MMVRRDHVIGMAKMAGKAAVPVGVMRAMEARDLFRNRGYTEVTLTAALRAWMARVHLLPASIDLRTALVVDIGANEGAFASATLAVAPGAEIIAAEPAPGPRARLQARLGGLSNVTIVDAAVAATSGTATLHLTEHDHNSSLRRPRAGMTGMIGSGWAPTGEVTVPTISLDELVDDRRVDILKIDVQGSELDVLRGGEATLAAARAVLLEMNFFSQYEGDATFHTLHAEMARRGFALVNVSPPLTTPDGTAIFIDGCYARPAQ